MRPAKVLVFSILLAACGQPGVPTLSSADSAAAAEEVTTALRTAYDLARPDVVGRMLRLYPERGAVVSASAGRVMTARDSLESGIRYFWENVGTNMREPQWVWDTFHVDVLSSTAAVVTGTYRIPHRNPRNEPHVLGGAMTAVFQKREGRWVVIQEHLSDLPQHSDSLANTATHEDH